MKQIRITNNLEEINIKTAHEVFINLNNLKMSELEGKLVEAIGKTETSDALAILDEFGIVIYGV